MNTTQQLGTGIQNRMAFAQPTMDGETAALIEAGRKIATVRDRAMALGIPCAALASDDDARALGAYHRYVEQMQDHLQRAAPVRRVRPVKPTDEIKRAAQLFRGPSEGEMPADDATVSPENPGILLAMGFAWARGAGLVPHGMSSAAMVTADHNAIAFNIEADQRNRRIEAEHARLVKEQGTIAAQKYLDEQMTAPRKVAPPSQREILAQHVQKCADEILQHILKSIEAGTAWPHVMAEVQRRNAHARNQAVLAYSEEVAAGNIAARPIRQSASASVRSALAGVGVEYSTLVDYIEHFFGSYVAPRD
jgi:hypothetical protein